MELPKKSWCKFACTDLPKTGIHDSPSTFVSVSCVTPPDTRWSKSGQTEIIGKNCNPFYLTTVSFETSRNISVITRLRANVYEVQDRNMHKVAPIGQVVCSFRDILTSPDNKLVRDILGADGMPIGGKLTMLLWELDVTDDKKPAAIMKSDRSVTNQKAFPPNPNPHAPGSAKTSNGGVPRMRSFSLNRNTYLKTLCCNPCTKSYRFPNSDGTSMIQVQEIMTESKLNFIIPQQIIKIYLQEEQRMVEELNLFEKLSEEWERARLAVTTEHFRMRARYSECLEYLSKQNKGPQFKKSTARGDKLLEFVPINLHLQRLRVEEPGCKESLYDIMTVGAFAAHSMKFRHGGLKRMMQHSVEDRTRNSVIGNRILDMQAVKTLTQIASLKTNIDWLATDVLEAAKHVGVESMRKTAKKLSEKVTDLLNIVNQTFMEEAFNSYRSASLGSSASFKSPSDKSTTKSSSPSDSGNSSSRTSGTSDGESQQSLPTLNSTRCSTASSSASGSQTQRGIIRNLSEYMNVVKQVVEILPTNAGAKDRVSSVESSIKHLKELVASIQEQARLSISFLKMQEEYSNLSFMQSLQCRKDAIFSQALTALVTGVMIKLRENIFNKVFMRQMSSLGVLAHFEGLLSTYGDEMGMLEDFAIGVQDLHNVTFKLVENSTDDANMIPQLTGTRSNIVVNVPVLPSAREAIPEELLNGQPIKVYPVLFNIGVNEEQSLAELFGDTSFQDAINKDNLQKLDNYYSRLVHMIPHKDWRESSSSVSLDVLINSLRHHVSMSNSKKGKNVEILHISSQLARRLDGIRFTSCKSAKDRTAMSVTLEECMILQDEHQLHSRMFTHLLDTMRSEGTRRDNTRKNVGINKYAFNKVQLRAFPKLYRPPEGTYGKTITT